jgi:Ca2+-binding RTX toxin-like protein
MISPDGARVLFSSDASNLVDGDTNGKRDIFIKDIGSGAVTMISSGAPSDSISASPYGWSPDGTKVAFLTDGAFDGGDTNGTYDIYVRDLTTDSMTLVSSSAQGVAGDNRSGLNQLAWSPDGTKIAFESAASNLVAGDANSAYDIFVKDLVTGEVIRVSSNLAGSPGNGSSTHVAFSPDGTQLIFESDASDLVAGDTNALRDIFIATLVWGTNSDLLDGRGGDDTLLGGAGDDTLIGGAGKDTASFAGSAMGVIASLQAGTATGEGSDTLSLIENLLGSAHADILTGDKLANRLDGGAGADQLLGGKGPDVLLGGKGDDTLTGGAGKDVLTGGTGKDVFAFTAPTDSILAGPDQITDLSNADKIDLSAIDAVKGVAGNQAFVLVGAFTHHAGEAVLTYDAGNLRTSLQLDTNGDGAADILIFIAGDHHSFTHFVL